jgi:L-threonylcarbamoyladenylate synthase
MEQRTIDEAARRIRSGGLVAFPTETVYGLGANALDADAVRRIYEAKGRPATSPLIVHVSSVEMAKRYAAEWPQAAEALVTRHWPGPLTLVLRKTAEIPDEVTAGLGTVGLRMPAHPVALALIEAAGVPVAAPSANRFTALSPTTAEHVRRGLGPEVMVLDGGSTPVGIESTVVSLVGAPTLLRPGTVERGELERVLGPLQAAHLTEGAHPAPGMHRKHYSPRTRLVLGEAPKEGHGAVLRLVEDARAFAAGLYATLHELDGRGLDWIAVEEPPDRPEWEGVRDRLKRAAQSGE